MSAAKSTLAPASETTLPTGLRHIVLTGFMGAGKTTVGHVLAEALAWEFLDLDRHIETRAGASVPDIFARHGEPHFRRLESSALANALARRSTVLALGGGTPEQFTNRLLLEQTPGTVVVFLEAPFPTLFDRCMLQSFACPEHIRPLLASPEDAETRFLERQRFFHRLAHLTISTADLTPAETAQAILTYLAQQA